MKFFIHIILAMAAGIVGCRKTSSVTYAGSTTGGQVIPGSFVQNCYAVQFGPYSGAYDESKRKPLFAILWTARIAGSATTDGRNVLVAINGQPIAPDLTRQAMYALQPDHALRPIDLTPAEQEHLFGILATRGDSRPVLEEDEVWQRRVKPHLRSVEAP